MSRRARTALLVLLLIALGAAVAWAGRAPDAASSVRIDLFWRVLSGGGAPAASGSGRVALDGSLGQTAIGASASADGETTLEAGYWSGVTGGGLEIYLPLVLNGS